MSEREITVCRLDDIADPGSREFAYRCEDGTEHGFIVRRGGEVTAYINSCPHTGAALNWAPDKFLIKEGKLIMCGVHGAIFRPQDGHCLDGPCRGQDLTALPCRVVEDEIRVTVEG